jgi:UDP-glucose 4-epimerase
MTKVATEELAGVYNRCFGVPVVGLRYFTAYGPRQRPDMAFHRFLKAAHFGQPIVLYGDGEQTRDFTYVLDAATATALAGQKGVPGRVYNIGGGSRVSVNHVLALIETIVGKPLRIQREPPQKGDMRDTYADTSLAQADLGFRPQTTLAEGLAAEYAWLQTLWSDVLA